MPTLNASHVYQIVINVQMQQHAQFAHWIISSIPKVDAQSNLLFVKEDCMNSMVTALMFVLLDTLLTLSQISVKFVLKIADNAQLQQYAHHVCLH